MKSDMNSYSGFYTSFKYSIICILLAWSAASSADYIPPSDVPEEEIVAMIRNFMSKPDIPLKGERGYVEDIMRINAVDMEWDIGMSVHELVDPSKIARDADGKRLVSSSCMAVVVTSRPCTSGQT